MFLPQRLLALFVDELRKLLSDPEVYRQFLLSIDPVRTQNNVRDELRNETLQLASKFLRSRVNFLHVYPFSTSPQKVGNNLTRGKKGK
ncbi:hypothetical protein HanHA300_Chr11g0417521 [Helianthus annuus]|nr:hypothetical protein HanHA300_Chr11g0417521 [Helianthus annuus]